MFQNKVLEVVNILRSDPPRWFRDAILGGCDQTLLDSSPVSFHIDSTRIVNQLVRFFEDKRFSHDKTNEILASLKAW